MKKILLPILATVMMFSCKNDDDTTTQPVPYNIPSTYNFEREGVNTVSYSGQLTRMNMVTEISNYIKDTAAYPLSATKLSDMLNNINSPFVDGTLNSATDKKVFTKIAASQDYFVNGLGGGSSAEQSTIRSFFTNLLADAGNEATTNTATEGLPGLIGARLHDENGLEYVQLFEKSILGALLMDQAINHYLSTSLLDSKKADNTNKILVDGTKYTAMEHYWDEAYGYLYGVDAKYWGEYINRVNSDPSFAGIGETILNAFIKGRAAIVNNDYTTRDEQIAIIQSNLSKVCAIRAVYYLQSGETKLTPDVQGSFHALSEAYGFIYSLRFTRNPATNAPYATQTQVNEWLDSLTGGTNGLYDVDHLASVLDNISNEISGIFGFTTAQAADAAN